MKKTATYTIVTSPNGVGRYWFRVPAFPDMGHDLSSSRRQAMQAARNNLDSRLSSLQHFDMHLPPDRKPTQRSIRRKGTTVTRVRVHLHQHPQQQQSTPDGRNTWIVQSAIIARASGLIK